MRQNVRERRSKGDPVGSWNEGFKAAGPLSAAAVKIQPRDLQKTTDKEVIARVDDVIHRTLDSIDDEVILAASLRDRATAVGILIDKRQILQGKPTQIMSVEERRTMQIVVPELIREAKRRGMVIDVTPNPEPA